MISSDTDRQTERLSNVKLELIIESGRLHNAQAGSDTLLLFVLSLIETRQRKQIEGATGGVKMAGNQKLKIIPGSE